MRVTVTDPELSAGPPPARRWARFHPIIAGAVAGALAAFLVVNASAARPAQRPMGSTALITVAFDSGAMEDPNALIVASAVAWLADGTRNDLRQSNGRAWQPDRPVMMVTVAALGSCSIQVGSDVVDSRTASAGSIAVCVWRAPY